MAIQKKAYQITTETGLPLAEVGDMGTTGTLLGGFQAAADALSKAMKIDLVGAGVQGDMSGFSKVGNVAVTLKSTELRLPDQEKLNTKVSGYRDAVQGWDGNLNEAFIQDLSKAVTSVPTKKVDDSYSFKPLSNPSGRLAVLVKQDKESKELFDGLKGALGGVYRGSGENAGTPVRIYAKDSDTGSMYRFNFDPSSGVVTSLEKGMLKPKAAKDYSKSPEELSGPAKEASDIMKSKKTGKYQREKGGKY